MTPTALLQQYQTTAHNSREEFLRRWEKNLHDQVSVTPTLPVGTTSDNRLPTVLSTQIDSSLLSSSIATFTGVKGSLQTAEYQELRWEDATTCRSQFPDRVIHSTLENILRTLGTSLSIEKYTTLQNNCTVSPQLQANVLECYAHEKHPESSRTMIGTVHWLTALAQAVQLPDDLPAALQFYANPNPIATAPAYGHHKKRQYDAALRPCAAEATTVLNTMLNVEFTIQDPPPIATNPLLGRGRSFQKLQQAVMNAANILASQPTRLCVPTLSFHGKGSSTKVFFSILLHDRFEFTVIDDCFAEKVIPKLAALLRLLQTASPYELGCNPFLSYSFTGSATKALSLGDIVPHILHLNQTVYSLTGECLSRLRTSVFGRSTVVLTGRDEQSDFVIVKFAHVSEQRRDREALVVGTLCAESPLWYTPILRASYSVPTRAYPAPSYERKPSDRDTPKHTTERHLEIYVFETPENAKKLVDVTFPELLDALESLFEALYDAFRRRCMHRDISVGNCLFANGHILLIDWELGRRWDDSWISGSITGTLDMMSTRSLARKPPLPHDDFESTVYLCLKILTRKFRCRDSDAEEWHDTIKTYAWDTQMNATSLRAMRLSLWYDKESEGVIPTTCRLFRAAGENQWAALVENLMTLPLPVQQSSLADPTDYETVLASCAVLKDLAVKAIQATRFSS
ncbi:hypothetical protein HMN09_00707700 [Mycena chlorophos]|uniref:Fungal-type protein kinase domain-containing protein n=1 Tax=Mycena chlorophos TaxID=658473 RepID=A0A8H6SYG8_MYCCL|nr:hypothetical protein HMN09_00707700 [Mycena chlorophos]